MLFTSGTPLHPTLFGQPGLAFTRRIGTNVRSLIPRRGLASRADLRARLARVTQTSSSSSSSPPPHTRGWRKYYHQFRNKPATHLTAFIILHEVTAVLPFGLIFGLLTWTDWRPPVSEESMDEALQRARKLVYRLTRGAGLTPEDRAEWEMQPAAAQEQTLANRGMVMEWVSSYFSQIKPISLVHLATTYALVKLLLPVRIATSLALTPSTAKYVIGPLSESLKFIGRYLSRKKP